MRISHAALYVKDLQGAKAFYEKYFGAKANEGYHNPKTGLRTYFLAFDGGCSLEIMTAPGMSDKPDGVRAHGYAHVAFSVGSRENVDAFTSRLLNDGFEVASAPRVTGDGFYESCVLDPEGNQIEITQ